MCGHRGAPGLVPRVPGGAVHPPADSPVAGGSESSPGNGAESRGWGAAVTAALPLRPRHGAVRGFAVARGQAQELAARGIDRHQGSGGPRHSAQEDYLLERRLLLGRAAREGGLHQGVEPGDHMCDHHQQAGERQGRLGCLQGPLHNARQGEHSGFCLMRGETKKYLETVILLIATQIMRRKKIILMNQKLTFLSMLEAQ